MKNIISVILLSIAINSCGSGAAKTNNLPDPVDSLIKDTAGARDSNVRAFAAPSAASDTGTLEGTWYLVAVLPSDTAAGRIPVLTFNPVTKSFNGNTGCNSMRGTYAETDSTLKINEQIITTKMACPGYNENAFLKSLPTATTYKFENGMLILMMDGAELSRWTRQPAKPTTKTA